MMESHQKEIKISEVKPEVFKAFLEYIYCHQTTFTKEITLDLFLLADKYSANNLQEKCAEFLSKNLELDSAIDVANAAYLCRNERLQTAVTMFIIKNGDKFNESDMKKLNGGAAVLEIIKVAQGKI